MSRSQCLVLAGIVLATLSGTTYAQGLQSHWGNFKQDYQRNHCWPDPFVAGDRAAVNAPFLVMIDNGWQRQNLLCDYHFIDGGTELNQAGEQKLWSILTQAPAQHRTVFVQRSMLPKIAASRTQSIERAMVRMSPRGAVPQVMQSNLDTSGFSGEAVEASAAAFNKVRPEPKLPTFSPGTISNN